MSHPIKIVKAADIQTSGGQTAGMIRQNGIVDVCDNMCSLSPSSPVVHCSKLVSLTMRRTVMKADPHTSSDIHHHGEESTHFPRSYYHEPRLTHQTLLFTSSEGVAQSSVREGRRSSNSNQVTLRSSPRILSTKR